MTQTRVKRLCLDAMLLGVCLLLSYLEAILPLGLAVPVPGVRLGIANIAVMAAFFGIGRIDAVAVSFCRVLITALLFGSVTSFWFAFCGAVCAYLGMLLCDTLLRGRVTIIGTSVLCAALHCTGQIIAACAVLDNTALFAYLGMLLLCSLVTGTLCGIITGRVLRLFKEYDKKHN